ncbi:GGDEF domain-containing protein [soil metagenome]
MNKVKPQSLYNHNHTLVANIAAPLCLVDNPKNIYEQLDILQLGQELQASLDIKTIMHLFAHHTKKKMRYSGISFNNKENSLKVKLGKSASYTLQCNLLLNGVCLGELLFRKPKAFTELERHSLCEFSRALLYPLHNALDFYQAEQSALRDPLTSIANRAAFVISLRHEVEFAKRYQQDLALLVLDLDHFKNINDKFGHAAGDHLLQSLTKQIAQCTRQTDMIFRVGGEEFCILLKKSSKLGAKQLAERIRLGIEKLRCFSNTHLMQITASIGVASCRQYDTTKTLFEKADRALYRAKKWGRNRVV